MKYIFMLATIIISINLTIAQNSGSGTLEWWSSVCFGQVCTEEKDDEDIYWIVAPEDGTLVIDGSTNGLVANCDVCTLSSNPIASSVFRPNGLHLGSFSSTPTVIINCLAAGDSIGVRFYTIGSGYYGSYEFNSIYIENGNPNDVEPNDRKETAQVIPLSTSTIDGHIYYGYAAGQDTRDYFEIGTFAVGDSIHWSVSGEAGNFSLQRQGSLSSINMGVLPSTFTGYHIISATDTYYVVVSSVGSAPCGSYEITLSGDQGHREYFLGSDFIEIQHDQIANSLFISGDFTNKFIKITNASDAVVQDLSGMSSPIIFDVATLPEGKHFLVIRDSNNAILEIQDLVKE